MAAHIFPFPIITVLALATALIIFAMKYFSAAFQAALPPLAKARTANWWKKPMQHKVPWPQRLPRCRQT